MEAAGADRAAGVVAVDSAVDPFNCVNHVTGSTILKPLNRGFAPGIRPVGSVPTALMGIITATAWLMADGGSHAGASSGFFQYDTLGRLIVTPTNSIPASLLPPPALGIGSQVPMPARGMATAPEVHRRIESADRGTVAFEWFSPHPPPLMPYLAGNDRFGNTALRPGPLIDFTPVDVVVQQIKYDLSQFGLNYSFVQTLTVVQLSNTKEGGSTLGAYTLDFSGKWIVYSANGGAAAGWFSTQIESLEGIGEPSQSESPRTNLGTFTNPTDVWSSHHGFRIPELAWQQSLWSGKVVMIAGVVSQGNYLDANSYANSARGQFQNSALVNSMVLPLPSYNPSVNLQWQPVHEWYALAGLTAGNTPAGQAPWSNFTWDTWSAVGEVGYVPKDVFGLGPGVYRIQPFIASNGGPTQGGLGFNLQQQLGHRVPVGWFGRFGAGGSTVANATAQIGTGFVVQGPLKQLGITDLLPNDGLGLGFVWSRPAPTSGGGPTRAETVLEAGYVMQLTPTTRIQPDVQFVWNPSYHADADNAVVLQLQFELNW